LEPRVKTTTTTTTTTTTMSKKGFESYFARVANDILQSADQIVTRMEEGISVLMTGELPKTVDDIPPAENNNNNFDFDSDDADDIDNFDTSGILDGSPLQGMAEQVLDGIMRSQVCMCVL
jgi:wobble nucleotide-excising tRNase